MNIATNNAKTPIIIIRAALLGGVRSSIKDWRRRCSIAVLNCRSPSNPDTSTVAGAARAASSSATRAVRVRTCSCNALSSMVWSSDGSIYPNMVEEWPRRNAAHAFFGRIWSYLESSATRLCCLGWAAVAFAWSPPAFAWGDLGHRVTSAIAEHRLSPSAKREVAQLLARYPAIGTSACRVTSLGDASVWADCVRSRYRYRFAASAPWHYVDVPICGPFDIPSNCADGQCVVAQVDRWRRVLSDRGQSPLERLQALLWLAHLIGDLHQPLHVGDNGDRGGNKVVVNFDGGEGRGANLHAVWDRDLPERLIARSGGFRQFVTGAGSAVDHSSVRSTPTDWAMESWSAARRVVYPSLPRSIPCDVDEPPFEHLDITYERTADSIVRDHLIRAGVRLGFVLEQALGSHDHTSAPVHYWDTELR